MKLNTCTALLAIALLGAPDAHARGGGGHVTKFDANIFGGPANVSCLVGTSVAGVCNTGYSATCNGTGGGDQTALTNWRNAVKGSAALAVLYIPPGSNCVFTVGDRLVWDGVGGSANWIPNSAIWAYGVTTNFTGIGGLTIPLTTGSVVACALSNRIATSSAGATTVTTSSTMVNGSTVTGVFTAGTRVMLSGVELQQPTSYPPNFQFFEYNTVVSVAGNTVTLATPLINTYKSTWPLFSNCAGGDDNAGPATMYKLVDSGNASFAIYGLSNTCPSSCGSSAGGTSINGRDVALYDVVIYAGFPTASQNWWSFHSTFAGGAEFDKEIQNLTVYRGYIENLNVQSASIQNLNLISATIGQTVGMPLNATFINSNLGALTHAGAVYGVNNSITLDGTTIINSQDIPGHDLLSYYSYASGTFSVPIASVGSVTSIFVPGGTYRLIYYVGGPSFTACSPSYVFKVTDLTTNGTDFQAVTGTWTQDGSGIATPAALPALTNACAGSTANRVATYSASTIKQINSPAGSANITGYAAPY